MRRSGAGARSGTSRTRRYTPRRRPGYPRRRRPGTATSFGTVFGLLLVYLLLRASWPVRIGAVLLAIAVVLGYLVVVRRAAPQELDSDRAQAGQTLPPDHPQHNPEESA